MVSVTVGTNTQRKTIIVEQSSTISDIFAEAGVSYSGAVVYANGDVVSPEYTLEDCGVEDGETCMVVAVVKADSAR